MYANDEDDIPFIATVEIKELSVLLVDVVVPVNLVLRLTNRHWKITHAVHERLHGTS